LPVARPTKFATVIGALSASSWHLIVPIGVLIVATRGALSGDALGVLLEIGGDRRLDRGQHLGRRAGRQIGIEHALHRVLDRRGRRALLDRRAVLGHALGQLGLRVLRQRLAGRDLPS